MANDQLIAQVDELLNVEHFDAEVRRELLGLGPDALELLRQYATGSHPSGDPDIQGRAIIALGDSGEPDASLPALEEALTSADPDTRIRVMRSLGHLGGAEATRVLRDAVANDQLMDAERSHGIRALAMIDSDEARASLADLDTRRLAKPVAEELQHARDRGTD